MHDHNPWVTLSTMHGHSTCGMRTMMFTCVPMVLWCREASRLPQIKMIGDPFGCWSTAFEKSWKLKLQRESHGLAQKGAKIATLKTKNPYVQVRFTCASPFVCYKRPHTHRHRLYYYYYRWFQLMAAWTQLSAHCVAHGPELATCDWRKTAQSDQISTKKLANLICGPSNCIRVIMYLYPRHSLPYTWHACKFQNTEYEVRHWIKANPIC